MRRTAIKLAMAAMLGAEAVHPAASQGLSQRPGGDKAIEGIVGDSEIRLEKTTASAQEERVIAAIDKTADNISAVRKLTAAREVDIVFLADAAPAAGGPPPAIESKLKEHQGDVLALRQEVEGNALLFHAIDSKRVMVKDILAVEFPDPETVIVFAASRPAD